MTPHYVLLSEAAATLHCKPYQIAYLLSTRRIPEPVRIGGRRAFTTSDLARIAEVLELQKASKLAIRGEQP